MSATPVNGPAVWMLRVTVAGLVAPDAIGLTGLKLNVAPVGNPET